jgi:hypothetical protein
LKRALLAVSRSVKEHADGKGPSSSAVAYNGRRGGLNMPDYSDWPEKKAQPNALLLDAENPRIPPTAAPLSQRHLIGELVAHDRVYELAREIAHGGFDPVESLVGFEDDDGKTIIVEGNRRLAALKLLIDPNLAPIGDAPRFKRLASLPEVSIPAKVRVLVAPSDAPHPDVIHPRC